MYKSVVSCVADETRHAINMAFGIGGETKKKTQTKEGAKTNQETDTLGFGKMWQHPFSINHSSSKEGKTKAKSSTKSSGFFSRTRSNSRLSKKKSEDGVESGGLGFWKHPFASSPELCEKADDNKPTKKINEGRQNHWPSLFASSDNSSKRSKSGRGGAVKDATKTIATFSLDEVQDGKVDIDTTSIATTSQDMMGGNQTSIPERLVDYFIVIGTNLQEQLPKLKQPNIGHDKGGVASSLSLPTFEPQVLDRVPKADQARDDMEFPNQVSCFVSQMGIRLQEYNTKNPQYVHLY